MKKVLFATTAIVLTAGAAAAQNVSFSGTARAGLAYQEDRGFIDNDGDGVFSAGDQELNDTQVNMRLRFNIDASKETDSGVTFGGRVRIQYDQNISAAQLNAAYVYAEYNGLRVEVGNVGPAMDSDKLIFNSEIGYIGQTFGSYAGQGFLGYASAPYGLGQSNRMGVAGAYSIAGFNIRGTYITPNQTVDNFGDNIKEEFAMTANYNFGAITVSGAFALNAGFIEDRDAYFLGGEYAINPDANVGLHINYTDFSGEGIFDALDDDNDNDMTTVTLYGNYKFGAITGRGYVAHNNADGNESDFAIGLGADYDLGGATLAGHVARNYDEDIQASLGVKFSF